MSLKSRLAYSNNNKKKTTRTETETNGTDFELNAQSYSKFMRREGRVPE